VVITATPNVRLYSEVLAMPEPKKTDPPAKADPENPTVPTKKYRVSLKDNPELVVEAWDRKDAEDKYKATCGIISTVHPFSVTEV
jgi:hypothetical protein